MKKLILVVLLVSFSVAVGYAAGKDSKGTIETTQVKAAHENVFEYAPQGTMGLVSFDAQWIIKQTIDNNWGLFEAKDADKLREKLSAASKEYLGIDITTAEKGVLWVAPMTKSAAIRLEGEFDGELKGTTTQEHNGIKMVKLHSKPWAAVVDDDLLVGTQKGVKTAIDLAKGTVKSMATDETAVEQHKKALNAVDDGAVVISGHIGALGALLGPVSGLESMAMSLNLNGYSAAIIGKEETMTALMAMYELGKDKAKSELKKILAQTKERGIPELILPLILVEHKFDEVAAMSGIKKDGDTIKASGTGVGPIMASSLGIGAAVAIPAFIKYQRKAKMTVEEIEATNKKLQALEP